MKKSTGLTVFSFLLSVAGLSIYAESVTNNLNLNNGIIYNHGAVNPGDIGMTFTNEGIRDITVSAGQLSGIDPETGAVITNAANLLPLKAQSLTAVSNIVTEGVFIGNGSGLTNLNASFISSGSIDAARLPTSGSWNAAGVTVSNLTLTGSTQTSLTITSNLTVQGTISGNGSGLTNLNVAAGGNNGELQFNENGVLAGNTNFFMHPTEHKLAFRSQNGNIFRAYSRGTISDSNLIYSLRYEGGTSALRLRQNGQDSIRLSGDGSAYIKGNLQLDGQLVADGSGLTNLTAASITGTIPVEQIPVASTNSSGLLTAADKQKLDNISTNGIPGDTSGCVLLDGSRAMTGNLDLNGNRITNLADASSDADAASQGKVKTLMQQVPEYGDLSMGEFTSQVATPDRPLPTVIHTEDIATSAVTTEKLDDGAVTLDKMDQIAGHTVLGNMTNEYASPTTVEVKDEDDMASDSSTALASQQSIKAYVDQYIANRYGWTLSNAVTLNTTGAWTTFLESTNAVFNGSSLTMIMFKASFLGGYYNSYSFRLLVDDIMVDAIVKSNSYGDGATATVTSAVLMHYATLDGPHTIKVQYLRGGGSGSLYTDGNLPMKLMTW